jgi:hypothetical protein
MFGAGPAAAGGGGANQHGNVGSNSDESLQPRVAALAGILKRQRNQTESERAEKVEKAYDKQCLAGKPDWNASPPRVVGPKLTVSIVAVSGGGGRSAQAALQRGCTSRGMMYGGIEDKKALRQIWAGIDDQESKNCCLCGFPLYNEYMSFFNGSQTRKENMGQTSPEHFIALSRYGATLIGIPMKGEVLTDAKKELYRKNLKPSHLYCNYQKRQLQFITWPEDDDYPKLVDNLDDQLDRFCYNLLRGDAELHNGSHAVLNPLKGDFKAHSNIPRYFIRYYMCKNPNDDIELAAKIKEWKLNTINRFKLILNNIIATLRNISSDNLKTRYSKLLEGKFSEIQLTNVPLVLTERHFPIILLSKKVAGMANAHRVRGQILSERNRVGGAADGGAADGGAADGGAAGDGGFPPPPPKRSGGSGGGGQRKRTRRSKNRKRQTRKR